MIKPIFNNKLQTNFKGITIVNIPQKAFSNPKDSEKSFDEFCEKFSEAAYSDSTKLEKTLACARKKHAKYLAELIGNGYFETIKNTKYSIEWAQNHTGINLKKPMYKNTYSFYVFTKEDKNEVVKKFNFINLLKQKYRIYKEKNQRIDKGLIVDNCWENLKYYQEVEKSLDDVTKKGINAQITVSTLDEIPEVYEHMKRMKLI